MYALALAVGIHELLQLRRVLDLEKHLLSVLDQQGNTWLFTFKFSCSGTGAGTVAIPLKNIIYCTARIEHLRAPNTKHSGKARLGSKVVLGPGDDRNYQKN